MKLPNTLMTKLLLALVAITTAAFAADPFVGSWKVDQEKSTLSSQAREGLKGIVLTLTLDLVGKDTYRVRDGGGPADAYDIWVADGKEHQEQHLGQPVNIKVERLGDLHMRTATWYDKGEPLVFDWTVSADGKTLTAITKNGPGPVTIVYSKQ